MRADFVSPPCHLCSLSCFGPEHLDHLRSPGYRPARSVEHCSSRPVSRSLRRRCAYHLEAAPESAKSSLHGMNNERSRSSLLSGVLVL